MRLTGIGLAPGKAREIYNYLQPFRTIWKHLSTFRPFNLFSGRVLEKYINTFSVCLLRVPRALTCSYGI